MLKRFILFIEREPWDEAMLRQERYLNRCIVVVLILSVLYFSPVIWHIFNR